MFEPVHTITDYWDGPREGVADCQGTPHWYRSEWSQEDDDYANTFVLLPLDAETHALLLEDWQIWLRWKTALQQGRTGRETHPALPADRARHDEISRVLDGRLGFEAPGTFRMVGEFVVRSDLEKSAVGYPVEVEWSAPK